MCCGGQTKLGIPVMAARNKKSVFVGNLDKEVTDQVLYAAFIPFGPIKEVQIPKNYASRTLFAVPFRLVCLFFLVKQR